MHAFISKALYLKVTHYGYWKHLVILIRNDDTTGVVRETGHSAIYTKPFNSITQILVVLE